jgi:hypothetical protein
MIYNLILICYKFLGMRKSKLLMETLKNYLYLSKPPSIPPYQGGTEKKFCIYQSLLIVFLFLGFASILFFFFFVGARQGKGEDFEEDFCDMASESSEIGEGAEFEFDEEEIYSLQLTDYSIFEYESTMAKYNGEVPNSVYSRIGSVYETKLSPNGKKLLIKVSRGNLNYDYLVKDMITGESNLIYENGYFREFNTGWVNDREVYIWTSHGSDCASSMKIIDIGSKEVERIYDIGVEDDRMGCLIDILDDGNILVLGFGYSVGNPGPKFFDRSTKQLYDFSLKTDVGFSYPFPVYRKSPDGKYILSVFSCEDFGDDICVFVYEVSAEVKLVFKDVVDSLENYKKFYDEIYSNEDKGSVEFREGLVRWDGEKVCILRYGDEYRANIKTTV